MENIIPIAEIPDFIARTIAGINDGVARVRKTGLMAELPKEVAFDMTIIGEWQSPKLAIISFDTGTSTEKGQSSDTGTDTDSGSTVENSTGTDTGTDTETGSSIETSDGADTSTDTETGTSTETGGSNESSTRTESGQSSAYGYNNPSSKSSFADGGSRGTPL